MKYNLAIMKIPDPDFSEGELVLLLKKIFSSYFLTDRQCKLIYSAILEFRHDIAADLIKELENVRLRNVKNNILDALEIDRFAGASEGIISAIVEAYTRNYLDLTDLQELLEVKSNKNSGLKADLERLIYKITTIQTA